jgi:phosphoribosylformylglycinamidine synthase
VKVHVHVFLKPGVLDVQGKAIEGALHSLGFPAAGNVRVGRVIELELEGADAAGAEAQARQMAERLLANPVIESYRVEAG